MTNFTRTMARIVALACVYSILPAASARATTRTVTKAVDSNDGLCDADCSLREAVAAAVSGDTIVFSALFNTPQVITLSNVFPLAGGLIISTDLTIVGPGADVLTVAGIGHPVFEITAGTVVISEMTISGTNGAINNSGTTTVSACVLQQNDRQIYNLATMTVVDTTITQTTGFYAAVTNLGHLSLHNSTVSNGIFTGIENHGTLSLTNATLSGVGHALDNDAGTATLTAVTLADNVIGVDIFDGLVIFSNTIVALNATADVNVFYPGTTLSAGYNLIGNDAAGLFTNAGDQTGTAAAPLDPMLDPLADYGGMTPTHRLRSSSPAIDTGFSFGLTTDQRGFVRPFDRAAIPNAIAGDGSDIGAYELQFTIVISGRVFDGTGNPLKNVRVLLRSATGEKRAVKTDRTGMYHFNNVARNRTYQLTPMHHGDQFTPRIVKVMEANLTLDFAALP